jgi:eukaryotic-like serine/threonine-protein kinase
MKRMELFVLIGVGALALSACGTPSNVNWPGLAADGQNAYLANGNLVYAVRLSDGLKLWQYPEKSSGQMYYSNPVVTAGGQVLIGSSGTDYGLVSLDGATGRETWAAPLLADNHWVAPPLVVADTVYAVNNNGSLYAAELATGGLLWSLPIAEQLWSAPTTNGTLIFVSSLDHNLYAVDPAARAVAWSVELGGSAPGSATVSADGNTVFVGSFGKKIIAVEAASGKVKWSADTGDWIWGAPVQGGDSLFAADTAGQVYSLGVPNGKNAWPAAKPDGAITASPVLIPGGVVFATETGSLVALDNTGATIWKLELGGEIYATPVVAGDMILVAPMKAESLLRAVSLDGRLLPWEFTGK